MNEMSERKLQHIDLANESSVHASSRDDRFFYEPLLGSMAKSDLSLEFLGKKMNHPFWISSMTGGTNQATSLNKIMASVAGIMGLGMGLGSCRILLGSNAQEHWKDFDLRRFLKDSPFWANLGIAQIEGALRDEKVLKSIKEMVRLLEVDGLIVHVNPLQEWLQPEGDRLKVAPIETLRKFLEVVSFPVIVKEVGQGMGPESLLALLELPLAAMEFAAFGGTNFSKVECLRRDTSSPLIFVGHTASEMVESVNRILDSHPTRVKCKEFIISGGIKNFLDAHYLMSSLKQKSIYGQAGEVLKQAQRGEEFLRKYLEKEMEGLSFARSFLKVK